MNYSEQLIKEHVKRCEQKYGSDPIYNKCLEKMKEIDLEVITVAEVAEVVQPFLYNWGRMGRVLGRKKSWDWRINLAEQIRSNCEKLKDFKTKDLADVELSKFESDVKNCYGSFKEAVGQIGAAKVLHLICPNFFAPWDNDIAKGVRNELNGGNKKVEEFSAAHYYIFMQEIQNFIRKYEKVLSDLAAQYKKDILRIVDECLWWATRRPLSLLL